MFWHCADLWFAVMQKLLFSECTVAFRQFSFINQAETGVKSYKEQIKLTLFRDCKPSWIFNKDAVDISSVKVATTHELQHTTRADIFFVERLIASNLQYIWFFSCWFVHSKKSQKLEAAFTFWHFKPNIMIKCSVECQSLTNPKSQKLQLNSVQCDWQLKRKLLERNSTKNLKPVYLSLWGKATRKFWLVSHRMCHQQFMSKIAASMILTLHNSHHAGNEMQLVTAFWVVL